MRGPSVTESSRVNLEIRTLASVYASPAPSPFGHRKGFDREVLSKRRDSVMDYNDPSRREYSHHQYTDISPQQHRQHQQQQQQHQHQLYGTQDLTDQFSSAAAIERFRPTTGLHEISTVLSSAGRAGHDPYNYAWGQGTQYGAEMAGAQTVPYATNMQILDNQRQPDQSLYAQYATNIMYTTGQTSTSLQQPTQLQYDQFRYQDGPPAGDVAQQYAMPQTSQYTATPSVPSLMMAPQAKYMQTPSQYQSSTSYAHTSSSAFQTEDAQYLGQELGRMAPVTPRGSSQHASLDTEAHRDLINDWYHDQIRAVFTHIQNKSLREAVRLLENAASYLLTNVGNLGLNGDDNGQHYKRLALWDEFNNAWLTLFQAQYDLTQAIVPLSQGQNVLQLHELEQIGDRIVLLNDGIEQDGLVDYQTGVAEDMIMDLLLKCISLLESQSEDTPTPRPSASAAAREQERYQ